MHNAEHVLTRASIPVTPLDLEIYSWELIGLGEFAPAIEAHYAEHLDETVLRAAVRLLIGAEPVLGCRLVADAVPPRWQPMDDQSPDVLTFTEDEDEFERVNTASPDAAEGPQLSAVLWRSKDGDRLLLKVSHAAGDGGSILYCLERLAEIYSRLLEDPDYRPAVSTGRRDLGHILRFVPKRAYLGVIRDWVKFGIGISFPKATHHMGLPMRADHPWHYLTRRIAADRVSAISQYGRARGSTLNDVFLTSFYRTLVKVGRWDGKSALRTICTIDLRQWFLPDRTVDSVSNFSSGELPFLGKELGVDYEDTLGRVTRVMNDRKRSNPGLAIALLTPKIGKDGLSEKRLKKTRNLFFGAGIPVFTNAGRLDGQRLSFGGQMPTLANFLSLKVNLPMLVTAMSGYNGMLTLSICAADSARVEFEAFLDELMASLPA